ncbi:hypothetical protein P024_02003 [Enterococcus faecalis EnGen0424]|nr:hypothetical protein P024_02003 [Enterococcus faecalis EnGen0424]
MGERKTFSGDKFRLNRWGDAIYLREARKGEICTEIREFIPDKKIHTKLKMQNIC